MGTKGTARVQETLEYLNSEEPGDASQATAIDVVERLLVEEDAATSQKVNTDYIGMTKPASILGTVAQCLAKRAQCNSPFQRSGSFDWDDALNNDECPASVISRKKQRIHAKTQMNNLAAQIYGGNGSGTKACFVPECTEDNSGEQSFKKPKPVGSTDDFYEAYDIGPCTQMAAEAMEALSSASTVNFVVREDEHIDGSILISSSGKERAADEMSLVESSVENRIGRSSSSSVKHPSKLGNRNKKKVASGKAKRSMCSGIIQGTINHEVPEGIMGSGEDKSNILGSDAVIHPKRKRTYMFISGSSKVQFNKASRSTTVATKSTELADSSKAKTVSIPDPDFNQIAVLKEQSRSLKKDHNSSLTRRVPLRELNSTPQSSAQISEKPQKRGLQKSPGSRELASLFRNDASQVLPSSRQRRNMSKIRVLLSQSMDKETIKLQTKILAYFGLSAATSISDATHFVAEKFARTRNMLEAIARGLPIVTPSWLECCGEARCFIDENKYILRDIKKEKELNFSMSVSLSQARRKPLLEGRRVLITPHAKPSKEVLKSLIVAAHGQPLERITAPMMKNKNFEGTFAISCEQDHRICLPLIKNGFKVFDSELLLNGIITQKLEFERYRLFYDKAT